MSSAFLLAWSIIFCPQLRQRLCSLRNRQEIVSLPSSSPVCNSRLSRTTSRHGPRRPIAGLGSKQQVHSRVYWLFYSLARSVCSSRHDCPYCSQGICSWLDLPLWSAGSNSLWPRTPVWIKTVCRPLYATWRPEVPHYALPSCRWWSCRTYE